MSVVECIHDLTPTEREWIERVAERVRANLDEGLGVVLWEFTAEATGVHGSAATVAGGPAGLADGLRAAADALTGSPDLAAAYARATSGVSLAEALGTAVFDDVARRSGLAQLGVGDVLATTAQDADGGVGVAVVRATRRPASVRLVARCQRIAAHLLGALRLRRALARAGEALQSPAILLLPDDAARALDAAQGALRRLDPDEANARWKATAEGRWMLVDSTERGGRRFVIAWRHETSRGPESALSRRERQVATYSAQGMGIKEVAAVLGVASSTVGTHLASAMRKLKVRTRAELVAMLGGATCD